jgi:lipopolysaccharide/colanic/teichoic acid biosynthesis glycosyltransferase
VLEVRPGITDPATLEFRHEEELLAAVAPERREAHYLQEILPRKLERNLEYLERRGFWSDLRVIARTLVALLPAGGRSPASREKP